MSAALEDAEKSLVVEIRALRESLARDLCALALKASLVNDTIEKGLADIEKIREKARG